MKRTPSILAAFLLINSFAMAQQTDTAAPNTKALLGQIEAGMKQQGWSTPGVAMEVGPHGLKKIPAFVELQNQANTVWPQVLGNIQSVAPSENEKAIILMAFESSLSSDNYLQFTNQAATLVQNKTLDKQFLLWALFPSDKNVRGIFAYNYDKPVVIDTLQKVKGLYADKPNVVKFCDSVLSGGAKKESEDYLKDNPAESRPVPASK